MAHNSRQTAIHERNERLRKDPGFNQYAARKEAEEAKAVAGLLAQTTIISPEQASELEDMFRA